MMGLWQVSALLAACCALFGAAVLVRRLIGSPDGPESTEEGFTSLTRADRLQILRPLITGVLVTIAFFAVLSFLGFFSKGSHAKELENLLGFLSQSDGRSEVVDHAARALWCVSLVIIIVVAVTLIRVAHHVWREHTRTTQFLVLRGMASVGLLFIAIGLILWALVKQPLDLGGYASGEMLRAAWAGSGSRTSDRRSPFYGLLRHCCRFWSLRLFV